MSRLAGATIVFDLDGALADTAPDLLRALGEVLDAEGLPRPPASQMRAMVGGGARRLIERGAAWSGAAFPTAKLDALVDTFIDIYAADIARESRLFPGALAAMNALTAHGAVLCVCTNKRQALSEQLLAALGVAHRFKAIVGADSVANRKPHPEHFRQAVARAGGQISRAVMVGDTEADVGAAQGAGAPVIAVSFGYSPIPVHELGADAIIDHFDELEAATLRLLARP